MSPPRADGSRVSVSAICTYDWSLEQDLAFYAEHGITNVGISLVKLERHGWADAPRASGMRGCASRT